MVVIFKAQAFRVPESFLSYWHVYFKYTSLILLISYRGYANSIRVTQL
jgi:hypothetical protein